MKINVIMNNIEEVEVLRKLSNKSSLKILIDEFIASYDKANEKRKEAGLSLLPSGYVNIEEMDSSPVIDSLLLDHEEGLPTLILFQEKFLTRFYANRMKDCEDLKEVTLSTGEIFNIKKEVACGNIEAKAAFLVLEDAIYEKYMENDKTDKYILPGKVINLLK